MHFLLRPKAQLSDHNENYEMVKVYVYVRIPKRLTICFLRFLPKYSGLPPIPPFSEIPHYLYNKFLFCLTLDYILFLSLQLKDF
jgi:hypothetical protein